MGIVQGCTWQNLSIKQKATCLQKRKDQPEQFIDSEAKIGHHVARVPIKHVSIAKKARHSGLYQFDKLRSLDRDFSHKGLARDFTDLVV